jgi:hypothetical protein
MNKYRVSARLVCDCPVCQDEEQTECPNGVPFSDDFAANSEEVAKELAKRKFEMIYDDVVNEFKEEEGHNYRLEFLDCELVG